MSEKAYEVAHLEDLDRYPVDDEGLVWRPVRRHLGITAFGTTALTVRTSTKVKPGRHETVAATLRLMLKQAFDREAGSDPRGGLIPVIRSAHSTRPT